MKSEELRNEINKMEPTKIDMYHRYYMLNNLKEYILLPAMLYHDEIDKKVMYATEDILFGSGSPLYGIPQKYHGYKYLRDMIHDSKFQKKYQKILRKQELHNNSHQTESIEPTMLILLQKMYEYVSTQTGDIINCAKKLDILNEYIRIARFTNDGQVWTSGYNIDYHDLNNTSNEKKHLNKYGNIIHITKKEDYDRSIEDVGIVNNNFINRAHQVTFTEEEKQTIYMIINHIEKAKQFSLKK